MAKNTQRRNNKKRKIHKTSRRRTATSNTFCFSFSLFCHWVCSADKISKINTMTLSQQAQIFVAKVWRFSNFRARLSHENHLMASLNVAYDKFTWLFEILWKFFQILYIYNQFSISARPKCITTINQWTKSCLQNEMRQSFSRKNVFPWKKKRKNK